MNAIAPIVILGAAGHAKVVADVVRRSGAFRIEAFIDTVNLDRSGQPFCGSSVHTGRDAFTRFREAGVVHAFVALGNCQARRQWAETLQSLGFVLPVLVHPAAVVASSARLGPGTLVGAAAVVGPDCEVGEVAIINTRASVDHDGVIHDAVHVCPGVTLAGNVHVGRESWIGIGSTIIERIAVGRGCFIAAGAVVIRDVRDGDRVAGCPAKPMRAS